MFAKIGANLRQFHEIRKLFIENNLFHAKILANARVCKDSESLKVGSKILFF